MNQKYVLVGSWQGRLFGSLAFFLLGIGTVWAVAATFNPNIDSGTVWLVAILWAFIDGDLTRIALRQKGEW